MPFGSSFRNRESKGSKKLSNKSYYKSLIDNKQDSAFLSGMDGEILLANSKTTEFTGYSEDEFTGLHLKDVFVTLTGDDNPLDSGDIREFEKEMYLIDSLGYLIPVLLKIAEIEGGKFLGTITPSKPGKKVELADGREPIEKPDENVQTNRGINSQQRPRKSGSTCLPDDTEHVVRNSLNTILGFSTVLSMESSINSDKKLLGYIKSIINNGNKLKTMLNLSGKAVSDNIDITLAKCSLSAIIQKIQILLQSKADQNNIELVVDMPGDFMVLSDEGILFNVINYLTEKAITYCRNMFVDIKIKPGQVDGQLMLVIDNLGQDTPMSIKKFIDLENGKTSYDYCDEVLSSSPEMSTLLRNLNSINAKIKFETDGDFCDVAVLELPLFTETGADNDESRSGTIHDGNRKTTLIVEDDKLNAIILKMHLEQHFDTSTAFSGNEALNIIEMAYDKGAIFDIVFTDIGLPPPWDGITLKKEIIKRWPQYADVPFVAQTGYSAETYGKKIRESGFAGYLIKPINRNDVKKFVKMV